jgi:hypothetical protein
MILLLLGCANEPATWYYGEDLSKVTIVPIHWDEGVYPNTSVIEDPNNPFADGIDAEAKWDILARDPVPGFYAFATALAYQPTGEHQFYAANCLQNSYDAGRLAPDDLYWAWSAAVRGYQAVIDEFPDSVTYDATGTIAYPLAPLAHDAILALGGTPEEGTP